MPALWQSIGEPHLAGPSGKAPLPAIDLKFNKPLEARIRMGALRLGQPVRGVV